ncbi:hypothetical protein [Photobacterium rosenbergii]|uniref:DUF3899 domain-containing protein n=1 Tax=Photobacterium rosenbergii TaxID=294936 RepID=A0ABU3ZG07_9GAMM|nr:hypothetical protein [Photobacterium rosenbergii]MDV5168879.1 hypothetical protein [Photobacterium rosenbergii]
MLRILIFVLVVNGLLAALLHICELLFSVPELNFLSDYFFYALLAQWSLSGLFLIAKPGKKPYLKHSANTATRMAASIADEPKGDDTQSNFDVGVSMLLFISGSFSLAICIVL